MHESDLVALTQTQLLFVTKYVGPVTISVSGGGDEDDPLTLHVGGAGDGDPPDDPNPKAEPEAVVDDGSADRARLALELLEEMKGLTAPALANDTERGVIGPLRLGIAGLLDHVPSVEELGSAQTNMGLLRLACATAAERIRLEAEAREVEAGELLRRLPKLAAPEGATDGEALAIGKLTDEARDHLKGVPGVQALADGKDAVRRLEEAVATAAERIRLDRMRRIAERKLLSERIMAIKAPDKATEVEKSGLTLAVQTLHQKLPDIPDDDTLGKLGQEAAALELKVTDLAKLVTEERLPRFTRAGDLRKALVLAATALDEEKRLPEVDAKRLAAEGLRLDTLLLTYAEWDQVTTWTAEALLEAENAVKALADEIDKLGQAIAGHLQKITEAAVAAGKVVEDKATFALSVAQKTPLALLIQSAEAKGAKEPFTSAALIVEIEKVGKDAASLQTSLAALDVRIRKLLEAGPDGALKDERVALTKARKAALDALQLVLA